MQAEISRNVKKAGVNWLGLGIENPDNENRRVIHKEGFKEVSVLDQISSIREAGINVGGNYIFGLPFDDNRTMNNTLDFALENPTEMANFYCAMAYPGSPLYTYRREAQALSCQKSTLDIVNILMKR